MFLLEFSANPLFQFSLGSPSNVFFTNLGKPNSKFSEQIYFNVEFRKMKSWQIYIFIDFLNPQVALPKIEMSRIEGLSQRK